MVTDGLLKKNFVMFNISLTLMCVTIILFVSIIYYHNSEAYTNSMDTYQIVSQFYDNIDSFELYNRSIMPDTLLAGVYNHKGYYCVRTKNRDIIQIFEDDPSFTALKQAFVEEDSINQTAFHELVHSMIHTNYTHFCGDEE